VTRADPVELAHANVVAGRAELKKLAVEDRVAAARLAQIDAAPKLSRDDMLTRENMERRRRQLVGEIERADMVLRAARGREFAAVREADGVLLVHGALAGPGEIGARSSVILQDTVHAHGMAAPVPLPAGSRARVLAGLGIQFATTDSPRDEVLPFVDVRPDHAVLTARLLERPEQLGQKGVETVLLTVAASAPGLRSEIWGTSVRSMCLVSGVAGVLGLRVESDRGGVQFIPASNVAHAVLAVDAPGEHFVALGACTSARLAVGTTIGQWAAQREPLPSWRVSHLEAREGYLFNLARGQMVREDLGPAQEGVGMETADEIGVAIKWREESQIVPWDRIRAATIAE
jgi:hypothetical protein